MTENDSTLTYRGYPLVQHPSGIVGIFPMPFPLDGNGGTVISTAPNLNEAKQIIDAWLDAP